MKGFLESARLALLPEPTQDFVGTPTGRLTAP